MSGETPMHEDIILTYSRFSGDGTLISASMVSYHDAGPWRIFVCAVIMGA